MSWLMTMLLLKQRVGPDAFTIRNLTVLTLSRSGNHTPAKELEKVRAADIYASG